MRLMIKASTDKPCFIPINYRYQLHSMIYSLIKKSSADYADFLHDEGYASLGHAQKRFKLFTFSRLRFYPYRFVGNGFSGVRRIEFTYSTPVDDTFGHFVYGIFADQKIQLRFGNTTSNFIVQQVESLPEPDITNSMKLMCLSPITVSTMRLKPNGKDTELHFLDYLNPGEKPKFCANIYQNLLEKYAIIHQKTYLGPTDFAFAFDPEYLIIREGNISKLIHFKQDIVIKAFEAPFTIIADPELIKIGYQCGFGEKNSAGFGCVEVVW